METQLRKNLKELNKYRAHLEELAETRTHELTHANKQLQQEITERKRAEEALRESERRYRAIVEDQTELICRFLPDGTLTFVNKAYCQYFDKKQAELIGHSFVPLISEEDREKPKTLINSLNPENPIATHEHRVIKPNGEIGWQQWSNRAIFDEQGHIIEFQAVGRDITTRKQAEEQIKNQNILLEQAVQEKQQEMEALFERLIRQEKLATIGQIASSIAHELRNPLGAVKQSAFFLERLYQRHQLDASNPKVKEHLDLIEIELDISGRVISDLLQMTRMKKIQRKQTDLHSILVDAANHCHLPESIQLTIDLPTEPFLIWADPLQLRQVLINLLSNAVQAIEQEGCITISAKQLTGERSCVIEVEDNGTGIEPDLLDNVFEPLYTTKAAGTGLGLSICKQIIDNHHGQIGMKSEKGQGTTVTIVLPEQDK